MKDKSIEEQIEAEARGYCDNAPGVSLYNHNTTKKAYIAGRIKGIEREKELEERIKELEDMINDLLLSKSWLPDNYVFLKCKKLLTK